MHRGRKLRNPIEKLRTLMYVHQVFLDSGMATKLASEFGVKFESQKSQSDYQGDSRYNRKWDRIVSGASSPNKATIAHVSDILSCDHAETLFMSPIWKSLVSGRFSEDYWLRLIKTEKVFREKLLSTSGNRIKNFNLEKLQKIVMHQNSDALACLITLLRYEQSNPEPCSLIVMAIEDALFRGLVAIAMQEPFKAYIGQFWSYVQQHVIDKNEHRQEFPRYRDLKVENVEMLVEFVDECENEAKNMRLLLNEREGYLFRFLCLRCQLNILHSELKTKCLLVDVQDKSGSPRSRGLAWLVNEMNRSLPIPSKKNIRDLLKGKSYC